MKNETLIDVNDQSRLLDVQKWTPEPWDVCLGPIVTVGIQGQGAIAEVHARTKLGGLVLDRATAQANAARICEAVNATAGIQEPGKAIAEAREAIARCIPDKFEDDGGHHGRVACEISYGDVRALIAALKGLKP